MNCLLLSLCFLFFDVSRRECGAEHVAAMACARVRRRKRAGARNTNVLIDRRVAVLDRAVGRHARAANHANEIALAQQLRGELAFAERHQEGLDWANAWEAKNEDELGEKYYNHIFLGRQAKEKTYL